MSPLAPQMNGNQSFNHDTMSQRNRIDSERILAPVDTSKVTYSLGDLYGMRHSERRAPNLGDRSVLTSISRPNPGPSSNYSSAFSFNIMASSLNEIHRDRRQPNHTPRHQNYGNSHQMNIPQHQMRSASFNGDRHPRQPNRERGRAASMNNSVQIRLSIRNDVKLSEAENAWKPSFLQNSQTNDKDDAAELYKQVRLILNKLTAQNFGVMSEQFQKLQIDTKEKLVEVINLVFNKAVNEPNFSEGYAKLSQYLSHCSKQIDSSSTERAYFKRTLITKCQTEFEQHVANKNTTEAALAPLMEKLKASEKNGDTNGVNEIKAQIAEEESNLRRRLVSTVRFIGELYKLDMLTTNIMNKCINMLLREATINVRPSNSNQANEKLECLCKLLTTVGRKLERKPSDTTDKAKSQQLNLTDYMNQLKRIADNKLRSFKPSTRIKFMIMDVIELRNNNWVPKITHETLQQKQMLNF